MISGDSVASTGQAGKDSGAAYPANWLAYKCISKTGALLGQPVNIWSLGQRMTVATKHAGSLIIGKKENNIRFFSETWKNEEKRKQREEVDFHE